MRRRSRGSRGKIIPFGLTFEQALQRGYVGRMEHEGYLRWIRSLACHSCGAPPPSDPSHINNDSHGIGTKAPDWWAIPECRKCHEMYERLGASMALRDARRAAAAVYLLQAIFEGHLEWSGHTR